MDVLPLLMIFTGGLMALGLVLFALAGPSPQRAQNRRIASVRERHGEGVGIADSQMRRIAAGRVQTRTDVAFGRLLPNPAQLAKRLAMTGKDWTVGKYGTVSAGL